MPSSMPDTPGPRRHTLLLMRHAKSAWPDGPDIERPLSDRGRADAAAAGNLLLNQGLSPDLVVVSPAVRTRETWKLIAKTVGKRPHTSYDKRVYEATPQGLLYLVQESAEDVGTMLVIGH